MPSLQYVSSDVKTHTDALEMKPHARAFQSRASHTKPCSQPVRRPYALPVCMRAVKGVQQPLTRRQRRGAVEGPRVRLATLADLVLQVLLDLQDDKGRSNETRLSFRC